MEDKKLMTPWELFGVECGSGWNKLIMPLFEYIEQYNKDKDDDHKIVVLQCKEKFGGLRFYTNFTDKTLGEMIDKAEDESYEICEWCGEKGKLRDDGWMITLCDKCYDKWKHRFDKYKDKDEDVSSSSEEE